MESSLPQVSDSAIPSILAYLPNPDKMEPPNVSVFECLPPHLQEYLRHKMQQFDFAKSDLDVDGPQEPSITQMPALGTQDRQLLALGLSWLRNCGPVARGWSRLLLAALTCPWPFFDGRSHDKSNNMLLWDYQGTRGLEETFAKIWSGVLVQMSHLLLYDISNRKLVRVPSLSQANWGFVSDYLSQQSGQLFQFKIANKSDDNAINCLRVVTGWLRVYRTSDITPGICLPLFVGSGHPDFSGILNLAQTYQNTSIMVDGNYSEDGSKRLSPDLSTLGAAAKSLVEAVRHKSLGLILKFRCELPTLGYCRKYKRFRLFEATAHGERQFCGSIEQTTAATDCWVPNFADFGLWEQLKDDLQKLIELYQPDAVEIEFGAQLPVMFAADLSVGGNFKSGIVSNGSGCATFIFRG